LKLAHYGRNGETRVGLVNGGLVFDVLDAAKTLGLALHNESITIDRLLSDAGVESLQHAEEKITKACVGVPVETVKLLSPILNPEKILLLAVNYISHSKEQKVKPPTEPYLFTKFRNALIGPGDSILIPKISKKVDWEVELAVIIGKAGKYIARKDAMNHVAGYAISNDVSFRDFQFGTQLPDGKTTLGLNWVKGKGLDSSFPLGPWLVTKDEIPDPHKLEISLSVNGKRKQRSNTSDMVFKIDSLIEYVSAGITIKPGDIISTGTPQGVAAFTGEPFLKDGDIVEGAIDRIGILRNPVKAESD
jgi:2-keto-4-pentenoate hydratase/2-oxohepta-3-ene-1,7-dioic acid hydratase in catechol pathway